MRTEDDDAEDKEEDESEQEKLRGFSRSSTKEWSALCGCGKEEEEVDGN